MKKSILVLIMLVGSLLQTNAYSKTIHYNIDFSSPEHTISQPPATSSSITTPSEIVFGEPIVSKSLGALKDQPLVFNSLGNRPIFYYDQIELSMDRGNGFYYTSFDITTLNLIGSRNHFVVLFDTPTCENITFQFDGKIDLFGKTQIDYQNNELLHLEILINIAEKDASIFVNGNKEYEGDFRPGEYFRSIRFSHGLKSSASSQDNSSFVGIDNIIVADYVVPEPATLLLLGLGGLVLRKRH